MVISGIIAGGMSTIMCLFLNDGELFRVIFANVCNEKRLKHKTSFSVSMCCIMKIKNKKKYNNGTRPHIILHVVYRWRQKAE